MQEPKPKPAPQPVPQLSRAPARPAPPATEAAQLLRAAAPSDTAPSMKSSDKSPTRTAKPTTLRPASESMPPPVVRKAPRHPAGQAAKTSQAASSAATAEEISTGASDSAVQPQPLPQLRQAPLRPSAQAIDAGNAAADASPSAEQSAARVQDPAAITASLPPAPLPETVPEISPVTDGQASQASSQGAIAAGDDLAEPDQAAPASPRVAPAPLPIPQRPNKPRAPAMPAGVRPSSATSQGDEGSGSASDISSAAAIDRSEAAPPAAGAAEASLNALPQAPELLISSQPERPLAPSAATGDNKEGPTDSRAAPEQQEGGAGISLQPPAPPTALPKPALPAAQPDQTARVSCTLITVANWAMPAAKCSQLSLFPAAMHTPGDQRHPRFSIALTAPQIRCACFALACLGPGPPLPPPDGRVLGGVPRSRMLTGHGAAVAAE